LIVINVLPFLYFFYASAIIVKHGPLIGMRFGASTPASQKAQVQDNITQRQRPRRVQKRLSLAHVQKVVDTDKVEKLEKSTAAHRTAAIQNIQAREKRADARVRQRLRDRRQQKLKNEKKSEHSTKVVPVATAPSNTKKYDPTSNAVRVPVSVAIAAAVSSIPVETTMTQKDMDALRQSIHDKIGTVQKLQNIDTVTT
jgi:dTDP-4-amino-4,6-dideoxygalactose transaminase